MADIKTHLRELSVGVFTSLIIKKEKFDINDFYSSTYFLNKAKSIFKNDISSASNILSIPKFCDENKEITNHGLKLAKKICSSKEFNISPSDEIVWVGNDTQKGNPIDLKIGKYNFSLKEESFILKNMGLYSLLNNLTGSNYKRGLHVFDTFAKKEYDEWFEYTWDALVDYINSNGVWILNKTNQISKIYKNKQTIILDYNNEISSVPENINTNSDYMKYTTSIIREKVLPKWINNVLKNDLEYLKLKKICSETAGRKLSNKLFSEYKEDNIYEFFQIWPFDYYYAKTTPSETTILHVPNRASFKKIIKFESCTYNVPESQLNIISTFKNIKSNKTLSFRNECRFSHGQFNGTPEAKMYVVSNTTLTELYNKIE